MSMAGVEIRSSGGFNSPQFAALRFEVFPTLPAHFLEKMRYEVAVEIVRYSPFSCSLPFSPQQPYLSTCIS